MMERKQAFTAGVLRFCKSAGYDTDDALSLANLLLMPEVPGAQIVASMVLNDREQQVKTAGEFLCKRAENGAPTSGSWAPQNLLAKEKSDAAAGFAQRQKTAEEEGAAPIDQILGVLNQGRMARGESINPHAENIVWVTQSFVDSYGMPSEAGKTFKVAPSLEEAKRLNEESGQSQYNGALDSTEAPPTTTPAADEAPTDVATAEAKAKKLSGGGEGGEMGSTVQVSDPAPTTTERTKTDAPFADTRPKPPTREQTIQHMNEEAKRLGFSEEAVRAVHRHGQRRDALQQLFARAGIRFRPGQIAAASRRMTEGGPSQLEGGMGDLVNFARDVTTEQRRLNEELVGPRQSAGHTYSGFTSGRYAPRSRRGRQGAGTRGISRQPVARPPQQPAQPSTVAQREQKFQRSFQDLANRTMAEGGSIQIQSPGGHMWGVNQPAGTDWIQPTTQQQDPQKPQVAETEQAPQGDTATASANVEQPPAPTKTEPLPGQPPKKKAPAV